MQTAQEIVTFKRQRAEVPHEAVAIAPTQADVEELAAGPIAQEDELDPLVEQAKAGDQAALAELLKGLRPRAMAVAMRILRNSDDAEDAVQDAFVKIWRSFRRFEGRSSFATWVHRIVMNASLDLLRRSGGRYESHAQAHDHDRDHDPKYDQQDTARAIEQSGEGTPESAVAEHEIQVLVRNAIAQLPVLHRQAVELRELEDYSYQEMADIIQCPIGTVMSRLHHARHRLALDLSQPFANTFARAAA
jgi:RNA polymerase sigma-70 factor (ECF subfamily)